jgi:predicted TIM-barrel fold metal-dependent hydrolase
MAEKIFDIHTHLGTSPSLGFDMTADQLLDLMDRHGIEQAVSMPLDDAPGQSPEANDYVARAVAQYPDRLVGFARIHPKDGKRAHDEFRRCMEVFGMKGLKLHPLTTGIRVFQPIALELVQLATQYRVPVYYHSGDDPSTQPTMFELVVREVPEATIILGHGGGAFFWRDAAELARRYENVYLSTPGSVRIANMREAIEIAGATKILWGSDAPAMHPAIELAKLEAIDLPADKRSLIMYENSRRLLALN